VIVSIIIGALIFGYAGWALYRSVQKAKEGKCSGCSSQASCSASCACTSSLSSTENSSHAGQ
jgi:hypothetical protein